MEEEEKARLESEIRAKHDEVQRIQDEVLCSPAKILDHHLDIS